MIRSAAVHRKIRLIITDILYLSNELLVYFNRTAISRLHHFKHLELNENVVGELVPGNAPQVNTLLLCGCLYNTAAIVCRGGTHNIGGGTGLIESGCFAAFPLLSTARRLLLFLVALLVHLGKIRPLHATFALAVRLHARAAVVLQTARDHFVDLLEDVDDFRLRVDLTALLNEHHDAFVGVEARCARDARVRDVHALPLLPFRNLLEAKLTEHLVVNELLLALIAALVIVVPEVAARIA